MPAICELLTVSVIVAGLLVFTLTTYSFGAVSKLKSSTRRSLSSMTYGAGFTSTIVTVTMRDETPDAFAARITYVVVAAGVTVRLVPVTGPPGSIETPVVEPLMLQLSVAD
jgi:hypothetical protein